MSNQPQVVVAGQNENKGTLKFLKLFGGSHEIRFTDVAKQVNTLNMEVSSRSIGWNKDTKSCEKSFLYLTFKKVGDDKKEIPAFKLVVGWRDNGTMWVAEAPVNGEADVKTQTV